MNIYNIRIRGTENLPPLEMDVFAETSHEAIVEALIEVEFNDYTVLEVFAFKRGATLTTKIQTKGTVK